MMTSTSEMSGNASSGIRRKDQIPASTSNSVPVNTRKRFRAQQSIHRAITLHPSRGGYGDLFAGDSLAVFPRQDRDLPGSPASKLAGTFVDARSSFGECHWRASRETHCRPYGAGSDLRSVARLLWEHSSWRLHLLLAEGGQMTQ